LVDDMGNVNKKQEILFNNFRSKREMVDDEEGFEIAAFGEDEIEVE